MTEKQKQQFNKMRATLKKIAKDYQTPERLKKNSGKTYGLSYEETIEMSYENIQNDAFWSVKGVKELK